MTIEKIKQEINVIKKTIESEFVEFEKSMKENNSIPLFFEQIDSLNHIIDSQKRNQLKSIVMREKCNSDFFRTSKVLIEEKRIRFIEKDFFFEILPKKRISFGRLSNNKNPMKPNCNSFALKVSREYKRHISEYGEIKMKEFKSFILKTKFNKKATMLNKRKITDEFILQTIERERNKIENYHNEIKKWEKEKIEYKEREKENKVFSEMLSKDLRVFYDEGWLVRTSNFKDTHTIFH